MKTSLVVLIFALVVIASCQQEQDGPADGGKWTQEQLQEHLEAKYGEGVCWNFNCKQSCWAGGHKSGFCVNNVCKCIL